MWKKLIDQYFLSFTVRSREYEIFVTDFISLWTATYSEKAFVDLLKNSNEGLTLQNDKEFLTSGLLLLNSVVDNLKTMKLEEKQDNLLMTMKVVTDYPFGLKCTLSKCSKQSFFNKVMQPMLKTVSELKTSQDMLINLLAKKDKEIKAYRRELDNRKIIFPHEETKVFNDEEHLKMFPAFAESFGSSNIPDSILSTSPQNSRTQDDTAANVKQETSYIKQEPDSIEQEPDRINKKPDSIKHEPDSIKHEPDSIKHEPDSIKHEPHSIKQEADSIKQEADSSITTNNRRKKIKLSY